MNELVITPFVPGDEMKILELFKLVYNREMSLDYWRWRFSANPAGSHMIDLCWDGDTLAGHYAVSPVKLSIGGKEFLTALSMTTMTHPGYRKKGIFTALARSLYRRLEKDGVAMVWGFPNDNSYHGFMTKLNWFPLARIPKLVCRSFHKTSSGSGPVIEKTSRVDRRFDELWRQVDKGGCAMVVRDAAYVKWRYIDNPVNKYTVFTAVEAGGLSGYLVCKTYHEVAAVSGEIIDLLARNNMVARRLLAHAVEYLAGFGVDRVTAWMNSASGHYRVMQESGFEPSQESTHFGAMLNGPQISPGLVNDYAKWYITMGDSDVF